MKKVTLLIFSLFFLNSCLNSNANIEKIKINKKNIVTKKLINFGTKSFLKKSGIQKSREEIIVNSNAYGTVTNLDYHEGSKVSEGEPILRLKDNIKDYEINIDKANNTIQKLNLKYDSTEINYEKQENTLENNISSLKTNLENLSKNKGKNLEDIDINLSENNLSNKNSKSNLQLDKINNLQKEAELNFENKILINEEELHSVMNILSGYFDAFNIGSYDLIQFSDEILGVSRLNRTKNNKFDDYLGTKSTAFKKQVKNELKELINIQKNRIGKFNKQFLNKNNIKEYLANLEKYYTLEKKFLNNFEKLLKEYSIICIDFSQEKINKYVEEINSYQSKLQRANKDLQEFKNKSNKFLDSYKKSEEAISKKIDNIKKEKEILLNSLNSNNKKGNISKDKINIEFKNKEKELKNKINILEKDLEILNKDKKIKLATILNSIDDAKIGKKEALNQYKKLTIKSPINGIIKKIFINKGQQVNPGIKLFVIINNSKPQIKIYFSKEELKFLKKNMDVFIQINGVKIKAKLISFSNLADSNLKYGGIIKILEKDTDNYGEILNIIIPIKSKTKLINLKYIRLSNREGIGKIKILDDKGQTKLEEVKLGKILGEKIEILGCVNKKINCNNIKIIINN